jgi:hypothetical protein
VWPLSSSFSTTGADWVPGGSVHEHFELFLVIHGTKRRRDDWVESLPKSAHICYTKSSRILLDSAIQKDTASLARFARY